MKKSFFIIAAGLFSSVSIAQNVSVGFKTGLNLSSISYNDGGEKDNSSFRPALHAGIVLDLSLSENLSLQPNLLLSGRGGIFKDDDVKTFCTFNSIEIPINIIYKTVGNEKGRFFFGGGPNVGINISGKFYKSDDPNNIDDYEFGTKDEEVRRLDFGLNFLAGYELKSGIFVSTNYNIGLSNWVNLNDLTWKNNILAFSVGYFLKRR